MEDRQLPDTNVRGLSDLNKWSENVLSSWKDQENASVQSVDVTSKGDQEDADKPESLDSSEDENANEDEDREASSKGCEAAAVQDDSSRSWYRPEQRKKGRRGRGGKKSSKRSGKRGKRGNNHLHKDDTAEGDADSVQPDTAIKATRAIQNTYRPTDPDEDIETIVATASRWVPPSIRSAGSRNSASRPANTSSEPANREFPRRGPPRSFSDRPRNIPRTGFARRQAASARRNSRFTDLDGIFFVETFPMSLSFLEHLFFINLLLNDPDSD